MTGGLITGGGSIFTTRGGGVSITTGGGLKTRVGGLLTTGGRSGGLLSTRGGSFGGMVMGGSFGPPPGAGGGFELIGVIGFCIGWMLFGWQTFTTTLISILFQMKFQTLKMRR